MSDLDETIREIVRDELAKLTAAAKPDGYLSTTGAAKYADVSTRTIRNWIHSGKLKGHGTGRLRIRRVDLDKLLQSGSRTRGLRGSKLTPEQLADLDFG